MKASWNNVSLSNSCTKVIKKKAHAKLTKTRIIKKYSYRYKNENKTMKSSAGSMLLSEIPRR